MLLYILFCTFLVRFYVVLTTDILLGGLHVLIGVNGLDDLAYQFRVLNDLGLHTRRQQAESAGEIGPIDPIGKVLRVSVDKDLTPV